MWGGLALWFETALVDHDQHAARSRFDVLRPAHENRNLFPDLKSLLHIDKVMNKSQVYLNKMLALVMLAYAISLFVGEAIRDVQYTQVTPDTLNLLAVPKGINAPVGICSPAISCCLNSASVLLPNC
jgi:hypothetical protein